jgi:hypothetical protein
MRPQQLIQEIRRTCVPLAPQIAIRGGMERLGGLWMIA